MDGDVVVVWVGIVLTIATVFVAVVKARGL